MKCHAGNGRYEIDYMGGSWAVDLDNKECGCNQWQISGIPCVHAIAAIYGHRNNIEDYGPVCFVAKRRKS